MKNIKIKELVLENFKGFKEFKVAFDGVVTEVRGTNGTGKTTLFDAFTWCLFGKDSSGRTDFEIKTKECGVVTPRLDHVVTAVLEVNGTAVTLRRVLTEKWVKPRGKAETEFQGNETKYFYNGIEIKASAFSARVSEIMDEQLFKMVTSPYHFASLPWQSKREVLMTMAGEVGYDEVAAGDEELRRVLADIAGKDVKAYKAELAYRRKAVKEELDEIPVKVSGIDSVTPAAPDYAALDARAAELESAIKYTDEDIRQAADVAKARYDADKAVYDKVNALKMRQSELVTVERNRRQLEYMERNSDAELARVSLVNTEKEAAAYDEEAGRNLATLRASVANLEDGIRTLEHTRDSIRDDWQRINAKEYEAGGALVCPLSGVACTDTSALERHAQDAAKTRQAFEEAKNRDLDAITARGQELNRSIVSQNEQLAEAKTRLAQAEDERNSRTAAYSQKIEELKAKVAALPVVAVDTDVRGEDIEEWRTLNDEIGRLEASSADGYVAALGEVDAVSELQARRRSLESELGGVRKSLSVREVIASNNTKKGELLRRERELAQQMADIEGAEFAVDRLDKCRMAEIEKRVNTLFGTVRIEMFEKQINGGVVDACNIMVGTDGVKYGSGANHAAEVNAGLDIINALCRHHGVTAPIFIDNAEGVVELLPTRSQMIRLVVDENAKTLTVR